MLHFVFYGILTFLMAIGRAEECLASCRVTKAEFHLRVLVLSSTNCLGALDGLKRGGCAHNKASLLGNGIMGACFQAPHAAPGQRLMET